MVEICGKQFLRIIIRVRLLNQSPGWKNKDGTFNVKQTAHAILKFLEVRLLTDTDVIFQQPQLHHQLGML